MCTVSLLTRHLGLLIPCVSFFLVSFLPTIYLQKKKKTDTCPRGFLYCGIQLPTWGRASWCFRRWREVGMWSFTCREKTRLCSLLLRYVFLFVLFTFLFWFNERIYLFLKKASTTNPRSRLRSYPTLRIARFGDTILVLHISDLKFQNRLSIVLISILLDFRDLINMGRMINRLCIHSNLSWKWMVSSFFV